jgi:hypothetical protein
MLIMREVPERGTPLTTVTKSGFGEGTARILRVGLGVGGGFVASMGRER